MNTLLKALRLSKNWQIEDVARELEITPVKYEELENGEGELSINNAVNLGQLYSIPPETFFNTQAKIINNNIGSHSKGVVNTANYFENKEDNSDKN